jgi:DNA-binding MarR family transcriptional regulator
VVWIDEFTVMDENMNNQTDPAPDNDIEHIRQTNLGRLIEDLHFFFDRQALEYLRKAGFPMIKSADAHVMRTMRFEGSRITDMAAQAGISKQAMSKLVSAFIAHGFLSWADDPKDKRNRIVMITARGRNLLTSGIAALKRAESDVSDIVGADGLEELRQVLIDIKQAKNIRPTATQPRDRKRRG